jgi:phospholipid/cholesterol/gamma-HCH transport system permease protein
MADATLVLPETLSPEFVARASRTVQATLDHQDARLDCRGLRRLDSLGLAFFAHLQAQAERRGRSLILESLPAAMRDSLRNARMAGPAPAPFAEPPVAERAGAAALSLWAELRHMALLFSESIYHSTLGLRRPKTLLSGATAVQMIRLGSTALPIVLLLSFLIGFTLALQSGLQLQKFGATIFLADGIAISMVTEIGPVMTAVILAGRSGSAITAEIATMVVQEEVAALRAMAINPIHFLVLPRFWALGLTQPLLTVASCLAGIASGLLVGLLFFQLSIPSFMGQLQQALPFTYVWQALVKSVTFAGLIVFIAVTKGLNVRGGADAVGRATTDCVVTCIFAIILADAVFSFLFYL